MSCRTLTPGSFRIEADGVDALDIDCATGHVLVDLQVGSPDVREVVRSRSLSDGVIDDTRFLGRRAVTASIRIDNRVASTQALLDQLTAFMSPRLRPRLRWSLPGSSTEYRTLRVRGSSWPQTINGPRYQTIVLSFVSVDSTVRADTETCESVGPTAVNEVGRTYPLTFDRVYEPQAPVGGLYVVNQGTYPTPPVITVSGVITNPTVTVNDANMTFDRNGGLTLNVGQTVVIDVEARTIRLNGDPAESRYDRVNFEDWSWDDLLLMPGRNLVRIQGTDADGDALLTVCYSDAWV